MYLILHRNQLTAMGIREKELRRALRCCLVRVRRGRYTLSQLCEDPAHSVLHAAAGDPAVTLAREEGGLRGETEALRRQIAARREDLPPGAVFSHLSAALIHDLPLVTVPGTTVEAVQAGGARRRAGWRIWDREVPPDQREVNGGYRVTTRVRTLADIARDHPLLLSVPMLDSAFREEPALIASFRELTAREVPLRFRSAADAAFVLSDPLRESPAESVCAVRFLEYGLCGFEPQARIVGAQGEETARVDFLHRESKVVVEVDGEAKYTLGGRDRDDSFRAEREREYAIRNLGYRVYRLRWSDLFRVKVFLQIRHAMMMMESAAAG